MIPIDAESIYKQAIEKVLEFCQVGDLETAEVILRQLLRCDPQHKDGIQLLGLVRHKQHNYNESFALFSQAVTLDPNNADNYNNLALAQSCRGDIAGAIETLSKALDLTDIDDKSKRAQFLSNLSIQLRRAGHYEDAETAIKNAISYTESKDVSVLRNYAALLGDTLRINDSIIAYQDVIKIADEPEAHVDLAYSLHLAEQHAAAWKEYEYRYQVFPQFGFLFQHYDVTKLWKGEPLTDKTIAIYCEQGIGDLLQFVRYIPVLKAQHPGVRVILHYNEACVSLLKNSNLDIDDFFTGSPSRPAGSFAVPNHDYHTSILSLPHYTSLIAPMAGHDGIYLKPTQPANLGKKECLRVGICWAGSPQHPNDANRSIYLKRFESLSKLPVSLYGFQKDMRPRVYRYSSQAVDLMEDAQGVKFTDLSEHMTDLDKTAALLKEMDLIITVDTALLHLAGALGVETWGLIPYVPDWRWGLSSDKTPWYPTVTLFRQKIRGNWDEVFSHIEQALKGKLKNEVLLSNQ